MLQVELDGDGDPKRGGGGNRQSRDDQRQRAEGVHRLMQRMPDKAVQAIEAADAVMDGMKLP